MAQPPHRPRPLCPDERQLLAAALGDTPETVISVHQLHRGLCDAYVLGALGRPIAALLQATDDPTEPTGFGSDPGALWNLLQGIDGWTSVNVAEDCAPALGDLIAEGLGTTVRLYGDIFHVLRKPVIPTDHEAVRLLTLDDLGLLDAAPAEVRGAGFGSTRALLVDGVVAGTIIDGKLVAIAHTFALTDRHADIGVATLAPWQGQGLATAAASLVAQQLQQAELMPVWSAGEANHASLRLARRLGFTEVGRRAYVIPSP